MDKIRVLIVDDTMVFRTILKSIFSEFLDVEIVGTAPNGKIGLDLIISLKPDIVTLDMEMPEMDGLAVLKEVQKKGIDVGIIVLSGVTKMGSDLTIQALQLGAFDFIAKPSGAEESTNRQLIQASLRSRIDAFIGKRKTEKIVEPKKIVQPAAKSVFERISSLTITKRHIVGIGVSTGGPVALAQIVPLFPANFSLPITVVQHMPPIFTKSLAENLNKKAKLKVVEAKDGDVVEKGKIFIAPGGSQMKIVNSVDQKQKLINITSDPPEENCRPSVNYMFRSIANVYGVKSIGVILTGMGADGVMGLRLMRRKGAYVFAQDAQTSVVYGMPKEAVDAGVVDKVLPLNQIPEAICNLII
ncbi:chemotaxis response regulator protein-glutamate methylesterase [Candidatus Auribacterota bacterium]